VLIYIGALFGDLSVHDELEKMNTYPGAKNEGSRCPKKKEVMENGISREPFFW
jgi:hypothetical protein